VGRMSRGVVIAVAISLLAVPAARAQDTASTALNILPSGQFQTTGNPVATREAEMYNALTPLRANVTDGDLTKYFKSEALDPGAIVRTETVPGHPGLEIRRDAYNVPHIYGQTDDDVTFGAGYAIAEDRSLLLSQARFDALTAAIDTPNTSAIDLVAGLYQFEPTQQTNDIVARQTQEILKAGTKGQQLLHDIDTYIDGINTWYAANQPSTPPFTRNDIYGLNALKGQFLGQGGGDEVPNAEFLNGLQSRFGSSKGFDVFEDMRGRLDPDTTTTVSNPAPWNPEPKSRKGVVALKNGSYTPTGPKLATASAARATPNLASNILVASGSRSATGHPLFVGGPQISYYFPGLVEEMGFHGPDINVRGATSAPFPGYMLIGRAENFAWTLTSAGADIIDSYAETLCGGSKVKYEYKGKCKKMEKVNAGTITKGSDSQPVVFYKTVHGSVFGYAKTTKGKTVAISHKRSSYGKDTLDQLFFQDLTYGRVHSFSDFAQAASQTPQTFNSFYADANTAGVYTTGLLPNRPNGADSDLPTNGTGKYEWKGFLSAGGHPQGTVPDGLLVNWNNKPAPKFPASDDRFGNETMFPRDDMLLRTLAGQGQHTLGSVVAAMNDAATNDVRGAIFWPVLKAMLAKGKPPSSIAQGAFEQLDMWAAAGGPRVDADHDGNLDSPGVAIMDAAWGGLANAAMCPTLGQNLCDQLATRQSRFDSPNRNHGGQYSGWYHYMAKDFSTELGRHVKQPYSMRYCGGGDTKKCASALWKVLNATANSLAGQQGPDPNAWRESAAAQGIAFTPLTLIPMDYTNRPSGIQQVISFG
jgi:acyl-homoserine lactone acylase PvdQ